jgi:hypothetical protein
LLFKNLTVAGRPSKILFNSDLDWD